MIDAKKILNIVDTIGEKDSGCFHIIDLRDDFPVHEDERKYRVYHNGGYCFEVSKEVEEEDAESGVITKWNYGFYQEWDGFERVETTKQVMRLLTDRM